MPTSSRHMNDVRRLDFRELNLLWAVLVQQGLLQAEGAIPAEAPRVDLASDRAHYRVVASTRHTLNSLTLGTSCQILHQNWRVLVLHVLVSYSELAAGVASHCVEKVFDCYKSRMLVSTRHLLYLNAIGAGFRNGLELRPLRHESKAQLAASVIAPAVDLSLVL